GGGAFGRKDPSKVGRSGAYAARWAAKNAVAGGLARRCEIQLAYATGVAEPAAIAVGTLGTGNAEDRGIGESVRRHFDLTPRGIIEQLDLLRAIYAVTSAYGHFGREPDGAGTCPWESLVGEVAGAPAT